MTSRSVDKAEHELVIRGGTVVDGTGSPPRAADVAIDGGRITSVGHVPGRGIEEVDASGLLVTPGWVDIHTHYDGQATWDSTLTPSSWQGVTTAVMGNCGVGFAPVRPDRHDWLIELMEGVEDIPGTALHEGIAWEWESFPEYLDAIGRRTFAIDIAAQVPHGPLRGFVMGDRGADHAEVPTTAEIERMGQLAAEAIEAGALGFTTSRTVVHKSSDGRLTPSLTATSPELLGIAAAIGATGKGVFEVVADLVDVDAEMALIRSMAETSGRPLSLSLLQRSGVPADEYMRILGLMEAAAAQGVAMHGQSAARPVGLILTLDGRANPLAVAATYRGLADLPLAERAVALRGADVRDAILAEMADAGGGGPLFRSFAHMFEMSDPPRYDRSPDESLAAEAARRGVPVAELVYDALVANDGRGAIYVPIMNFEEGDLGAVRAMLAHPLTVPGLGDAGAHCTLICDASFPTFMLTYWGRDAPEDQRFPIEWVIQQQCSATAALVGLNDRGMLAAGYRADVNIIDLERLGVGLPEMLSDLPAGGRRLVQRAEGYVATYVAGALVRRDGELTGALPGRLVRGPQPAPVG